MPEGRPLDDRHAAVEIARDLGDDTSEADESAAIEAGIISATGFRYTGTVVPEKEPFQAR